MEVGLIAIGAALAVFTGVGAGIGMGVATRQGGRSRLQAARSVRQNQLAAAAGPCAYGIHRYLRLCYGTHDHIHHESLSRRFLWNSSSLILYST